MDLHKLTLINVNLWRPLTDEDMLSVFFLVVMVAINPSMEFLHSSTHQTISWKSITSFTSSITITSSSALAEKYVLCVQNIWNLHNKRAKLEYYVEMTKFLHKHWTNIPFIVKKPFICGAPYMSWKIFCNPDHWQCTHYAWP